jgi:hypothetical protein
VAAIPMRNARRACSSHVAIDRLAWIWRACLMTRFGGGELVELGDELLGLQEAHAAQCLRIQRLLIHASVFVVEACRRRFHSRGVSSTTSRAACVETRSITSRRDTHGSICRWQTGESVPRER